MKLFICAFLLFQSSVYASTYVFFSNNTNTAYQINSQLLDKNSNLKPNDDYDDVQNLVSPAFMPNLNTLRFNSNVHINNGQKYEFEVKIKDTEFQNNDLKFYITTQGQWTGSKIVETKLLLPNGSMIKFDPNISHKFDLTEWNHKTLYFIPFTRKDNGVCWPSFVLSIDQDQEDHFDFSSANAFKAINYNVQIFPLYLDLVNPPNNKNERAKKIPKLLGNNYDYISLNEVFDKDLRAQMIRDMESDYPYHVDPPGMEGYNILSGGVLVFSKWPILESKQYVYQSCHAEECLSNKGITYIKLQKTAHGITQNYNVFATHTQAVGDLKEKEAYHQARAKQIREFREFIAEQNIPQSEPVLISGDLNVDKYNNIYADYHYGEPMTEYDYLLASLNAFDPVQTGLKYSYDLDLNTMVTEKSRLRLDYILYSATHKIPLNAVNYIRTMRDVENPKMYPNYDTSDHFPVIGAFIF